MSKEIYEKTLREYLDKVMVEAFPKPAHDQESNVGSLLKRMFLKTVVVAAFNAGWVAAGKEIPPCP